MNASNRWLRRLIACGLVMLLTAPFGEAATSRPRQSAAGAGTGGVSSSAQAAAQNSDDATGNPAARSAPAGALPDSPAPRPAAQQRRTSTHQAVGTAAAPYEKPIGVPASRPAGAVIAPAKQKRAFSFLIRVGLIVGAAVAVGTVIGLSQASPSRPH